MRKQFIPFSHSNDFRWLPFSFDSKPSNKNTKFMTRDNNFQENNKAFQFLNFLRFDVFYELSVCTWSRNANWIKRSRPAVQLVKRVAFEFFLLGQYKLVNSKLVCFSDFTPHLAFSTLSFLVFHRPQFSHLWCVNLKRFYLVIVTL